MIPSTRDPLHAMTIYVAPMVTPRQQCRRRCSNRSSIDIAMRGGSVTARSLGPQHERVAKNLLDWRLFGGICSPDRNAAGLGRQACPSISPQARDIMQHDAG